MADRTVTVKLEANVAGFVADVGGKAVAAVEALNAAAKGANTSISKIGTDGNLDKVGTKATAAGAKVAKVGADAQAAGTKVASAASTAGAEVDKLGSKAATAGAKVSKVGDGAQAAGRKIGAAASAAGADVEKVGKKVDETLGAVGEKVKKTSAKTGDDAGKSFGAGMKKWFSGEGGGLFTELGNSGGTVFGSGILGALKTPILGPALLAAFAAVVTTVLPAVGAVAGAGLVAGFGAGIAGLGLLFAAKSDAVGKVWSKTLSGMGEDMKLLSKPFETTLIHIAGFFQRTVDAFNPVLAKAFANMAGPISTFVDQLAQGFEKLIPAVGPITDAFNGILGALGPAMISLLGDLSSSMTDLANSVAKNPAALADMVTGLGGIISAALGFITTLNNINSEFSTLTGGVSLVTVVFEGLKWIIAGVAAPFQVLSGVLSGVNALLGKTGGDTANAGSSMLDAAGKTSALAAALGGAATAAQHMTPAQQAAAQAVADAAKKANDAKVAFNGYITAMFQLQNLSLGLSGAQINLQQAIDAASASVKTNGRTLDINTEKGRANKTALDQIASSANGQTEAMLRSGKGVRAAADSATASRATFVALAVKMGLGKAQADALAKSLIAVPKKTQTDFKADITDLDAKIASAKRQLADPKLTATKKAQLRAEIAQLLAAKAQAQRAIDSLSGKTVQVTLNTYKNLIETHTVKPVGVLAPQKGAQANGGYYPSGVPAYADGKLPQQAMVAPGKGAGLVQWAEASTGGEAFIPLAPSKRDRSEMILGQVAGAFGMQLVSPAAAASGGVTADSSIVPRGYVNGGSQWGGGGTTTIQHHYHQANTFNGVDLNSADVIVQRAEAKQKLMGRF